MNREDQDDIDAERGYSTVGGREQRLRDWFALHEAGEKAGDFEKVINRLRVKKWQRENVDKHRAKGLRYYRKPGIAERQIARSRARRLERHRRSGAVVTCTECGVEFCCVHPPRGGRPRKYCSTACMQRERYQRIMPGARRIKRTGGQP